MTADVERVVAQVLTAARVENVRQAIAQALADTRQPFLDLADELDDQSPHLELPRGHVADMIRSVARNAP
jgi:hypothetical protein